MSHVQEHKDDIYAGPSKTIEVLGKGNAYGWVGSGVGLVAGAIAGVISSTHAEQVTDWFKKNFHLNRASGKTAIVVATALVGSQIGHWVTYFVGLGHGKKTAGQGQEQFARLKAQRDTARTEVEALKQERDALAKEIAIDHSKGVHADAATPGTMVMADGLEAQKESAPHIAR